ncbi:MAG: hypothetical protein ACK46K_05855 [Gammaproteobacteria bacterium]|jgi:hypothetical protein|nr:hypothetical protein [Xanthomonadaceae bacterium]
MNAQIFLRYCWQLSLLVLLGLAMVPDLPWRHAAVGLWPLWLLAAPVLALARFRWVARRYAPAARVSQVLVFPAPRKQTRGVFRKAA